MQPSIDQGNLSRPLLPAGNGDGRASGVNGSGSGKLSRRFSASDEASGQGIAASDSEEERGSRGQGVLSKAVETLRRSFPERVADRIAEVEEEKLGVSGKRVLQQAALGLAAYISVISVLFFLCQDDFGGETSDRLIDAFYFAVVTLTTVGYGDITPTSPRTELLAGISAFVAVAFIASLLGAAGSYILSNQEKTMLKWMGEQNSETALRTFEEEEAQRGKQLQWRVNVAVFCLVQQIFLGVALFMYFEDASLVDSIYATFISITTVGYGDVHFSSPLSRLFGGCWLLASTVTATWAIASITEARLQTKAASIASWQLRQQLTADEMYAADMDGDKRVEESEYILFKLVKMGKLSHEDVEEVRRFYQQENLDVFNLDDQGPA